jgi:hypothetical protein
MDLQEAVNGQLFFDNEDDMAGMGAGYGGVRSHVKWCFSSVSRAKLLSASLTDKHEPSSVHGYAQRICSRNCAP